jgi:hypothetical protein
VATAQDPLHIQSNLTQPSQLGTYSKSRNIKNEERLNGFSPSFVRKLSYRKREKLIFSDFLLSLKATLIRAQTRKVVG